MKTSIPVGSYFTFRKNGELVYCQVLPTQADYFKKFNITDPDDKYCFQYVEKEKIPQGAKIYTAKWIDDRTLVECFNKRTRNNV